MAEFVFNVRDYGAAGDGKADDTWAFEAALGAIRKRGGGVLYVEGKSLGFDGLYLIRPINLTSNLHVVLAEKASILGVQDEDSWPLLQPLPSYGQGRGGGAMRRSSLFQGIHVHNVTLQGHGPSSVINGQGSYWWEMVRNHTYKFTPGRLVEFMYSSKIRMQNLLLLNAPSWNTHFYDCDDVHVKRVDIVAPESSPFTDGFDPDSSRNVLIEDSYYAGGDDCVAIKSGWDCFGIDYGRPSVNITIRNLTCHGFSAGIAIGSEMSGGVENILVENVRFTKSNKPADIKGMFIFVNAAFSSFLYYYRRRFSPYLLFKVGKTRGGYVKNITFQDILVEGPIQRAIHVDMYHYNDSPNPACPPDWKPPSLTKISNLTFVRFDGRKATYYDYKQRPNETFHFLAYPESPIDHVYMEDVHFPTNGLAWNCTAVNGVVRSGTVEPWPPCEGFRIVENSHGLYSGFGFPTMLFLGVSLAFWLSHAVHRRLWN